MARFIYILFFFTFLSCNQENETNTSEKKQRNSSRFSSEKAEINSAPIIEKDELSKKYIQVITEYMKACNDQHKSNFDTLYIGIHADFPDIVLPEKIENTMLIPVIPEKDKETLSPNQKSIYLNIFGWVDAKNSEFIIVTFHVEKKEDKFSYIPQHNCTLSFNIEAETLVMKLVEAKFDFPYPNK